ncbi:MAG: hypothetical protein KAX33_02165, partial [Candidatus Lokiarchaeota archaeon]|nr:hypothetical protein [Candidatus Lokiarchaeota archaeon]
FPVTAYVCVSFYNSYDMLYDILKKVSEKTTPERMGKESRKILSELHALSLFYIPLYYMVGRMGEIQRDNGDPKSETSEKREQTMFILDFWKRLASSYFLEEKLTVYDSNKINIVLNQPDIEWSINQIIDVTSKKAVEIKKIMANLEVVSFLDECEARAKICDHGPYRISENEIMIFREIMHLYDGKKPHFPWSATEAKAPFSNIAFAFRLKDVDAKFDDFATLTTTPLIYSENITGIALFTRDGTNVKPIELDILDAFNDYAVKANKELFLKFSKWDRKQRLIAGAYAYCYGYARYTNFVGITDQIDWELTERTMNKYIPIFMESDFDAGIPRLFRSKRQVAKEGPSLYLLADD